MTASLSEPAKLLLLASLLNKDKIISTNGKCFIKDLILRRDSRLAPLLETFESKDSGDSTFLEQIHNIIADEAQALYNELFIDTSLEVGKTLSKEERDIKNLSNEKSLIYGEVEFSSFYRVLRKINPSPGLVFYDLGSGTGKAVFAARFTQDFSKCIGIEILESLHRQASKIVTRYNDKYKDQLALGFDQYAAVYEGSFLDYDWSDGDVVFANSTCFDDDLMLKLSESAGSLKPGAIVVTFTKGLTSTEFELLERKRYRMSWGPATVFIHRRLKADGTQVGPVKLNLLPSDAITYDDEHPSSASPTNNNFSYHASRASKINANPYSPGGKYSQAKMNSPPDNPTRPSGKFSAYDFVDEEEDDDDDDDDADDEDNEDLDDVDDDIDDYIRRYKQKQSEEDDEDIDDGNDEEEDDDDDADDDDDNDDDDDDEDADDDADNDDNDDDESEQVLRSSAVAPTDDIEDDVLAVDDRIIDDFLQSQENTVSSNNTSTTKKSPTGKEDKSEKQEFDNYFLSPSNSFRINETSNSASKTLSFSPKPAESKKPSTFGQASPLAKFAAVTAATAAAAASPARDKSNEPTPTGLKGKNPYSSNSAVRLRSPRTDPLPPPPFPETDAKDAEDAFLSTTTLSTPPLPPGFKNSPLKQSSTPSGLTLKSPNSGAGTPNKFAEGLSSPSMLNSPLDSALLQRKRHAQRQQENQKEMDNQE